MMNYRQPDELPDIPIAGRQVGDTLLTTANGVIHLPNCSIFGKGYTRDSIPICTCGAEFAKAREFVEDTD